MPDWLPPLLACPVAGCGGDLTLDTAELLCDGCETSYPVLADVAIVVPDPHGWMAAYRDAVLASLAEAGRATRAVVAVVEHYAGAGAGEALRFSDDWVAKEVGDAGFVAPAPAGQASEQLDALLALCRAETPGDRLLALLSKRELGTVLELGPGASGLTAKLRKLADEVLLADVSLRAVLRGVDGAKGRGARVAGLVMDAHTPALRRGAAQTIIAENVIDLLEDPVAFLDAIAEVLPRRGRLGLTTPDPSLGMAEAHPTVLAALLEDLGFKVAATHDGLPWAREHGPRHVELYLVQALVASR